jgi:DNA (cytosine-5)-methyltransferase 1
MRFGSVCSGIEAASVAWEPLGFKAAWIADVDRFANAVTGHHFPHVPNLGDMTTIADRIRSGEIEAPDILVGGTPCQSFSIAGLRGSLLDDRGNLALEFIRIADAIDDIRRDDGREPAFVLWENVPGVLSVNDNAFGTFLAGLVGDDAPILPPHGRGWTNAGVVSGPRRVAAWRVLDAQYFGLAQRRKRVFVLSREHPGGWACADALLPIIDSLQGHPAPSRETGPGVAAITANGVGTCGADDNQTQAGHLIASTGHTAHCLNAGGMGRQDYETETLIAFSSKDHGADAGSIAPTLRAMGHAGSHANAGGQLAVAFAQSNDFAVQTDVAATLTRLGPSGVKGGQGAETIIAASSVRRLTPRECERLQGFPDDYTLIPYRKGMSADGPRYKALGNSMAVPVMRHIGQRIAHVAALSSECAA